MQSWSIEFSLENHGRFAKTGLKLACESGDGDDSRRIATVVRRILSPFERAGVTSDSSELLRGTHADG